MRKADENKLNADIICVPRGKLGHLVNSLTYDEKILKYDNYAIVGGLNNSKIGKAATLSIPKDGAGSQ